jgi:hypothetical protein
MCILLTNNNLFIGLTIKFQILLLNKNKSLFKFRIRNYFKKYNIGYKSDRVDLPLKLL